MGSIGFCGESGSQNSTSNSKKFKLPRKLLDDCRSVHHAAVPRKLRSAIKKRGLESMTTLPWPMTTKQNRACNGVETHQKNGAKKSKLNMKRGRVTKDEKEVAETLYLLANMFSDALKTDKQGLDVHPSETNSSTVLEAGSTITAARDTGKIATRVTLEAICQTSNLVDSTSQIVQFKSFDDSQLSKLLISRRYPISLGSGDQSDLITCSSRTQMSALTTVPSDQGITVEQVAAPGTQNCPREDKRNDLLLWPPSFSSKVTQGSEILESSPRSSINKLPAWFENTNNVIQHRTPEESLTKNKHPLFEVEPMRSWKRCSAHVYISNFIKVMQVSDRKEGLPGMPARLTTRGWIEDGHRKNIDNQENGMDSTNGALASNSSSIQDTILLHKSLVQDQQQASKLSALCSPFKQGSDFLSLTGHSDEVLKQFDSSYLQSQNNLAMLLSQPQNCYSTLHDRSSAVATQQKQLPQPHSSRLSSRVAVLFPAQYHPAGVPTSYLPDCKNGERDSPSLINCDQARALFPHLHSSPGSKHQQFPQQQFNAIQLPPSFSNVKGHIQRLPSGFDRNGAASYPGSMSQLQILCNQQHL